MKKYKVCDPNTGQLLVEGTAPECAEALGIKESYFRRLVQVNNYGQCKKFYIENVDPVPTWDELIQAWDDLVTPIRKKYGIPVYRKVV